MLCLARFASTGTLRGIFLGGNPVQGVRDSATGEYSGAVPDMLKEIAHSCPESFLGLTISD
jgi:hypothetical protein